MLPLSGFYSPDQIVDTMACRLVRRVAICPQHSWEVFVPLHSKSGGMFPEDSFKCTVKPLDHSVTLQVVGCCIQLPNSHQFAHVLH